MSRLAELIEELCPDGVEFRRLDELFATRNGYTPSRSDMSAWDSHDIPWFRMEDIRENGGILDRAMTYVSSSAVKNGVLFPENSMLVATSATIGAHALITVPHLSNQRFTSLQLKDEYRKDFDYRFLYYYCFILDAFCLDHVNVSSFPSVDMKAFRSFEFPLVPLAVQREIVRILDQFTTLEAELEAELEARRTQYEYYRNHLLSYESLAARGPVEMVKLGDVIAISRGASPRPISKYVTQGEGIPWIKIGDVDPRGKFVTSAAERITSAGAEKSRKVLPGDFILSNSMSFGRPYILQIEGCVHDGWLILSNVADHWIPDFLYHSLRTDNVQHQFAQLASGGTVRNLNSRVIESVELPLPPKAVQEEIVSILDRFDALVNDITSGLPAEIAARRAQYEHYRDRLLSFPEKAVSRSNAS